MPVVKPPLLDEPAQQLVDDASTLKRVLGVLERAWKDDAERCARYERMRQAYRGKLAPHNAHWDETLAPPELFQIAESLFANLLQDYPRSRILPTGPEDEDGAEKLEKLLDYQRRHDRRDQKLTRFVKQGVILGKSAAKISWGYEHRTITRKQYSPSLIGPPVATETKEPVVTLDQPEFTPLRLENFWHDPDADSMEEAGWAAARFNVTRRHLLDQEASGLYRNCKDVTEEGAPGNNPDKKNRIELVEFWTRDRIVVIANRKTIIRDEPNPYWHGELPFVVFTPIPEDFGMGGISLMELLAPIQNTIWEFTQQSILNTRLVNNGVVMRKKTQITDDQDATLVIEPMAVWDIDPGDVQIYTPPQNVNQAAQDMISRLKESLEGTSGAIPYLTGAATDTVDQNTATGISIIQSMAQMRLIAMRNQLYAALHRAGMQEIKLDQQFITQPRAFRVDSGRGFDFVELDPADIAGEYDFDIQDANESIDLQKRRQEALLLFQTLLPALPTLAAFGVKIDPKPMLEHVLDAYDQNPDQWIVAPEEGPPQAAAATGLPPDGQAAFGPALSGAIPPPVLPGGAPPAGSPLDQIAQQLVGQDVAG